MPGIQDLNKDQDEALALPLEGQHLIVGGPGTGKSVVALLRAHRLAQNGRNYRTLVFNHLLDRSNRHLFGSGQNLSSKTWDSWFRKIFTHFFGIAVPTSAPDKPNGFNSIDWEAVGRKIETLDNNQVHSDKFLVIDEGQDMPPAFYRALIQLGFENFYVAADQNQQIHPDKCSSRQEIEDNLAIEPGDTLN